MLGVKTQDLWKSTEPFLQPKELKLPQGLRALATLPGDPSSNPSPHTVAHKFLDILAFSGPMVHRHAGKTPINMKIKSFKNKKDWRRASLKAALKSSPQAYPGALALQLALLPILGS